MSKFKKFAAAVEENFQNLQQKQVLFTVDIRDDELYQKYLSSFPEGTNPIFRERTEHDCSNCKGFIRNFGGVVAINDDLSLSTVWDGNQFEDEYKIVAEELRGLILSKNIVDIFHPIQRSFSQDVSRVMLDEELTVFHHFYGVASPRFVTTSLTKSGEFRTAIQVLKDSFNVLTLDACETVLGLIDDNQLYRGTEYRAKLSKFIEARAQYVSLDEGLQGIFLAQLASNSHVSTFKNSVIGSLVQDLSENVPLEMAVRSFEQKIAPQNYQRTNQIISQKMVDDAMKVITQNGLNINRRTAQIEDISVNNVLWVDSSTRLSLKDGLSAVLSAAVSSKPVKVSDLSQTEISADDFIRNVLPTATKLRLLVDPTLNSQFVALTTSNGEDSKLFKWDNSFAWSYTGNATDAIREEVKKAGGEVNALLRFSLSWFNTDDLDLSVHFSPSHGTREVIDYSNRRSSYLSGGLDVDMNISGDRRDAVENIAFTSVRPGTFQVIVHNFTHREHIDVGFDMQVAYKNESTTYTYSQEVRWKENVICFRGTIHPNGEVSFDPEPHLSLKNSIMTGEKWGLTFGQFADVGAVTFSPNYWDENRVGNKHTFFLLKDSKPDEQLRGLFNEFLSPHLHSIRKVFDVIGERMKPEMTQHQLSGIGVSSTLKKDVTLEVTTNSSKRLYKVQFGQNVDSTILAQEESYV